METVQTSVNIITLYPVRGRRRKSQFNCVMFCCCLYNLHTFSNIRCIKKVQIRWMQYTLKTFSDRVSVFGWQRKKLPGENIRRGRGFLCFFHFTCRATTSTPHVFVVFGAKHNFTLSPTADSLFMFFSIKYMQKTRGTRVTFLILLCVCYTKNHNNLYNQKRRNIDLHKAPRLINGRKFYGLKRCEKSMSQTYFRRSTNSALKGDS